MNKELHMCKCKHEKSDHTNYSGTTKSNCIVLDCRCKDFNEDYKLTNYIIRMMRMKYDVEL